MRDTWVATTLGEVCSVNSEATKGWDDHKTIRYVDLSSVCADADIAIETLATYRYGEAPGRARRVVRTGDTLVATVRPYLRGFARVPAELDGEVASTGFAVLRATERVLSGYLWAVVRTEAFVGFLMARSTGSNYPAVRAGDIAAYPLHLPPMEEQLRIADLASSVDRTIEVAQENLRRLMAARTHTLAFLVSGEQEIPDSYDRFLGPTS